MNSTPTLSPTYFKSLSHIPKKHTQACTTASIQHQHMQQCFGLLESNTDFTHFGLWVEAKAEQTSPRHQSVFTQDIMITDSTTQGRFFVSFFLAGHKVQIKGQVLDTWKLQNHRSKSGANQWSTIYPCGSLALTRGYWYGHYWLGVKQNVALRFSCQDYFQL